MSGLKYARVLKIFQDCPYARVLNFQDYTRFTDFCKHDGVLDMRPDTIMKGF